MCNFCQEFNFNQILDWRVANIKIKKYREKKLNSYRIKV